MIGSDGQTNVYAEQNSNSIVMLSSTGVPSWTNNMSPLSGLARRDAAGNFYFAGTVSGAVNFSNGTVLSNQMGGIAKFNSTGALIWARGFGPSRGPSVGGNVNDLEVDPGGTAYAAYSFEVGNGESCYWSVTACDDTTNTDIQLGSGDFEKGLNTRVGLISATNGYAVTFYNYNGQYIRGTLYSFTTNGATSLTNWFYQSMPQALNPIPDAQGNVYNAEFQTLTKRTSSGALIWSVNTGNSKLRTIAGDLYGGVHVADDSGMLARYDSVGNLAWSTNLGSRVNMMLVDAQGNRFVSLDNGIIAQLQPEILSVPVITSAPQGGTVFSGSNFTFQVSASGFTPFTCYWFLGTSLIPGQAGTTLALTNLDSSASGQYYVIVSNSAGTATSAPVTLSVKSVECFVGDQMLTNGTYYFSSPPTITIRSAFANGETFYTLDGSTPTFASLPYTGPFVLSNNATINAIGYSADFSQTGYADTVVVAVPPQYTLNATTAGGGTINLNPSGGVYASNTVVTATATPAAGYSFLYWQGAAAGPNPSANVVMSQNQSLSAVFGTTLSTTVQGNGQVMLTPSGIVYPYGSTVRLEAVPQPGNYFGVWGNAASGSANPLYFTITNPTPTVSSLFAPLSAGQSALTLLVQGNGKVSANPSGNVFANNATVTVTATPDAGQSFLYWSGDASSSQNPLTVGMDQSRVIIAHFSGEAVATGAPALAWTNNIGARVFAVDAQNHVYANSNGVVFTLSSTGAILQSNSICPLPAQAQRDATGNFYFFGTFDGAQNFGGITLEGGYFLGTNHISGFPTCFLAKYDMNGSLQWVTNFGAQEKINIAGDFAINPDGSLTVGYAMPQLVGLSMFDSANGTNVWQSTLSHSGIQTVKVSPLSGTSGAFLEFSPGTGSTFGGLYSAQGVSTMLTSTFFNNMTWASSLALNAEPVRGTNNDIFITSYADGNVASLYRWAGQAIVWNENIGSVEQWILAGDNSGNIYLAGVDGSLSKRAIDGTLLWTGNYGSPVVSLIFDAEGNRYISREDGSVGELLPDPGAAPVITSGALTPQGFRLSLMGDPAAVYQIFTSTNLTAWQSAGFVTNGSGAMHFMDSTATNAPCKFYRAVLVK